MKKIYMFLLFAVLAAMSAHAGEAVTYEYSGSTAVATLHPVGVEEVVIPGTVTHEGQTYTVTQLNIDTNGVGEHRGLKRITLPNTLTSINGGGDMSKFLDLEEVVMNGGNDKYFTEGGMLYEKESNDELSAVIVPLALHGKLSLPEGLVAAYLNGMSNLTELSIPASLTDLELEGCASLSKISVAEGNTMMKMVDGTMLVIDSYEVSFISPDVETLTVPEGITEVRGLKYCNKLRELTLPSTLKELPEITDYMMDVVMGNGDGSVLLPALERYVMPTPASGYEVIEGVLYSKNGTELSVFDVPNTITDLTVADGVSNCGLVNKPLLTKLTLPASAKAVAVYNCPALEQMNIPAMISDIEIENSYNIKTFDMAAGQQNYELRNGVLYDKNNNTMVYITSGVTSYHISADEEMVKRRFSQWPNLTTLTMDEREGYIIEDNVIYETWNEPSKGSLYDAAGGLTTVNLSSIMCELDAVNSYNPASSSEVLDNMQNLTAITVSPENRNFFMRNGIMYQKEYDGESYVLSTAYAMKNISGEVYPFSNMEDYLNDVNLKYCKIGDRSFKFRENVTSVNLEGVSEIGIEAFYGSAGLKKVVLDPKFAKVNDGAFHDCYNLADITFPEDFMLTSADAFYSTKYIDTRYGEPVQYINNCLYYVWDISGEVETLDIKEGTKYVSGEALASTQYLKHLILPSTLEAYWNRYSGYDNLETITIKSDNIQFLPGAFTRATNLKTVTVTSGHPQQFDESYVRVLFPNDLSNVTLIVPDDYTEIDENSGQEVRVSPKEEYAKAPEWSRFGSIVTGIDRPVTSVSQSGSIAVNGNTISIDTTAQWGIYSLSGQCVSRGKGNAERTVAPGLYIVKVCTQSRKVAVK